MSGVIISAEYSRAVSRPFCVSRFVLDHDACFDERKRLRYGRSRRAARNPMRAGHFPIIICHSTRINTIVFSKVPLRAYYFESLTTKMRCSWRGGSGDDYQIYNVTVNHCTDATKAAYFNQKNDYLKPHWCSTRCKDQPMRSRRYFSSQHRGLFHSSMHKLVAATMYHALSFA